VDRPRLGRSRPTAQGGLPHWRPSRRQEIGELRRYSHTLFPRRLRSRPRVPFAAGPTRLRVRFFRQPEAEAEISQPAGPLQHALRCSGSGSLDSGRSGVACRNHRRRVQNARPLARGPPRNFRSTPIPAGRSLRHLQLAGNHRQGRRPRRRSDGHQRCNPGSRLDHLDRPPGSHCLRRGCGYERDCSYRPFRLGRISAHPRCTRRIPGVGCRQRQRHRRSPGLRRSRRSARRNRPRGLRRVLVEERLAALQTNHEQYGRSHPTGIGQRHRRLSARARMGGRARLQRIRSGNCRSQASALGHRPQGRVDRS
jgi:hypothetical protein